MSHISGLEDKNVKAGFVFVEATVKLLTRETIREITQMCFREMSIPHNDKYTNFIAIAEDNGTAEDSGKLFVWEYPFPGRTLRIPMSAIEAVAEERREHEINAKPGQPSSRPKRKFLTNTTLVIVIGSKPFLGKHVRFYLEEEGLSRAYVFDAMQSFLGLQPWKKGSKSNKFVHMRPAEDIPQYKFYEDYFNALLDRVLPPDETQSESFGPQELLRRIGS